MLHAVAKVHKDALRRGGLREEDAPAPLLWQAAADVRLLAVKSGDCDPSWTRSQLVAVRRAGSTDRALEEVRPNDGGLQQCERR